MTAGAMSSPRRESHGSASNQGYGVFQKPRRSISTDSFLREATPLNLPSKYYTRQNRTPLNLAICVAGVLASLCIYGVLQERLMTIPYGRYHLGTGEGRDVHVLRFPRPHEPHRHGVRLRVGIYLTGDSFRTSTPLNLYASIAFSNLVTTVCQYEVLKYFSFAASTLAKCAKIIPRHDLGVANPTQATVWGSITPWRSPSQRMFSLCPGSRRDSGPAVASPALRRPLAPLAVRVPRGRRVDGRAAI